MGTVISVREKDAFYSYGGKSSHLRNCVCTDSPHSAERWSFSGPHVFEQLGPHQTERSARVPCLEEVNEATGKNDTGDAVRCPLLGREEVEEWKCCGVGSPMVREDTQHPWHRCAGPRTGRAYRDPFGKRPSKCKNWPVWKSAKIIFKDLYPEQSGKRKKTTLFVTQDVNICYQTCLFLVMN